MAVESGNVEFLMDMKCHSSECDDNFNLVAMAMAGTMFSQTDMRT